MSSAVNAQHSWKITHNGKAKISTSDENESRNRFSIKKTDFAKPGSLWVHYMEWEKQKDWERYIGIYDEKENELFLDTASVVQLTNKKLTTITKGVGTVKVYTWSLPTDPELAARIRIRRIHLATIIIQQ
jgi:hypothetical protein